MKNSSVEEVPNFINRKTMASMIEHTLLGDGIDEERIEAHLLAAIELGVFGVCVPMAWVPLAKKRLLGTALKIVTVVDFPLGNKSSDEKAKEAKAGQMLGADELDLVMDYQALKACRYDKALLDLSRVVEAVGGGPVKVIIETSALSKEQIAIACALVALSGAQFIKTSTGFHEQGARVEDIALMRALLPASVFIKASGGIRDHQSAVAMIRAGATRIGSSRSRDILSAY